ncbi:hypothetical protein Lal_00041723 [Lupinus albus]|nr:hypothetical protein Lal_00041723 [Lupinus albus]
MVRPYGKSAAMPSIPSSSGFHEPIIGAITVYEILRLLPKCHHAFHLPCIDTWLASHTNCPMCRAPIVTNPTRIPSLMPNNAVVDTSLENSAPHTPQGLELRNGSEEEGELEVQDETRVCEIESVVVNIRPRRSVSLDSSSVANVNLVLANVQSSVQSGENEGIVSKRFIAGNENFPTTSNSKRSSSFRTRYLHSVLFFY